MTTKRKSEGLSGTDAFQQSWLNGLAGALAADLGLDGPDGIETAMVKEAADAEPPGGVMFLYTATGPAEGELALAVPLPVCLRLAHSGEGAGGGESARELTAAGREAVAAVLARAAAAVAEATGISLTAGSGEPPAWRPAARAELQLTVPGQDPFLFTTLIAPPLAAALAPVPGDAAETAAATAEPADEVTAPPPPAAAADGSLAAAAPAATPAEAPAAPEPAELADESEEFPNLEKLGLLLDVPLDVTLRFGARQMVLKDILELGPGGVIELDRGVQEPVELMVAGRVVATGEVVIVDGNYGLRVGRIASPRQRLSGLL